VRGRHERVFVDVWNGVLRLKRRDEHAQRERDRELVLDGLMEHIDRPFPEYMRPLPPEQAAEFERHQAETATRWRPMTPAEEAEYIEKVRAINEAWGLTEGERCGR
jgi:hypothetical protein